MIRVLALFILLLLAAPAARAEISHQWDFGTGKDLPMGGVTDASGRYLYVAVKSGGLWALDVAGAPARVAVIGRDQLNGLDAMAVTRSGNKLYVALGDFFNAGETRAGLAVIDIAKPAAPRVISQWANEGAMQGAAAVLADGDTVYVGAMNKGVLVFDVSDPRKPGLVTTFRPDPDFPRKNPGRAGRPNARGLALYRNTLYVADDAGGLRAVDVSDPRHPRETGRYINPVVGRGKQQAYNNLVIDWPYAYAAVDYCGLEVIDIRDPAHMQMKGWWDPWHCEKLSNLWFNSGGHANQVVLDQDMHVAYLSAGASELEAVDVSHSGHPVLAAHYGDASKKQGVWGVTMAGGTLYLHYITAVVPFRGTWAGVRAVSVK